MIFLGSIMFGSYSVIVGSMAPPTVGSAGDLLKPPFKLCRGKYQRPNDEIHSILCLPSVPGRYLYLYHKGLAKEFSICEVIVEVAGRYLPCRVTWGPSQ